MVQFYAGIYCLLDWVMSLWQCEWFSSCLWVNGSWLMQQHINSTPHLPNNSPFFLGGETSNQTFLLWSSLDIFSWDNYLSKPEMSFNFTDFSSNTHPFSLNFSLHSLCFGFRHSLYSTKYFGCFHSSLQQVQTRHDTLWRMQSWSISLEMLSLDSCCSLAHRIHNKA